ncbi:MAG: single-stranded DNA-binding protein [Treponema sp.]|nr:single-stranded DNA-binding protein [Treponema sp.]
MNNLNSILIEGNLVRDPLLRSTTKGTQICSLSIASNRYYKQDTNAAYEKEVSFFDVETWAKLAEVCYSKGKKGRGVRVVGRLKQSRWNDPEGKSHSRVSIVAEHVEFRPEFRKDARAPADTSFDDDDFAGEEDGEPAMAMAGKELEAVAF